MQAEEGDLRLVGQREVNGYTFGALQIFLDGAFGAVCGANIFNVEADVACRQLGFAGGGRVAFPVDALSPAEVEDVTAPIVVQTADCVGTEGRLLDCSVAELDAYYFYAVYTVGPTTCENDDDRPGRNNAYVACGTASDSGPEDGELRLVDTVTSDDGLAQYGRLEVARFGGWGLTCDGGVFTGRFSVGDAQVACRNLGFADGFPVKLSTVSDDAVLLLPIWLANVGCEGGESSFEDCEGFERAATNTDFCSGGSSIELICSSGPDPEVDGRLRLAGGDSGPGFEYGRLEIFLRSFWSTACDEDGFSPDAAQVACRALGFDGGAVIQGIDAPELAQSSLPPGISRVDCDGTETSLLDCISSEGVGIRRECGVLRSDATDATVLACSLASADCDIEPAEEQDALRLIGGFGSPCDPLHSGIVEIFNAGEWGAICNDGDMRPANDPAATVICRQLGFAFGTVIDGLTTDPDLPDFYQFPASLAEEAEEPQERYWLRRTVRCEGDEERLVDCRLGGGFVSVELSDRFGRACSTSDGGTFAPNLRLQVECRQFAVA